MSNIEPNIIDPTKGPPVPPDSIPGEVPPIPEDEGHVGSDEVREPGIEGPPIEPDPEEGGDRPDGIEHV